MFLVKHGPSDQAACGRNSSFELTRIDESIMDFPSSISDSASGLSTECPHEYYFGLDEGAPWLSVCLIQKKAVTCAGCDFLLRLIETFRPGWIEENETTGGTIRLQIPRLGRSRETIVPTITLSSPQSINTSLKPAESFGNTHSFHVVRRQEGIDCLISLSQYVTRGSRCHADCCW